MPKKPNAPRPPKQPKPVKKPATKKPGRSTADDDGTGGDRPPKPTKP